MSIDKPDKREKRLDEALLRGDRSVEERLDPALVARLESWFGSRGDPPEEEPVFIDPFRGPVERDHEAEWRRARATEVAAAGSLLGQLERNGKRYTELIAPLEPIETALDTSIARFDLPRWGLRASADPAVRSTPEDIRDALAHHTPQALLRDLHRPIPSLLPVTLDEQYLAPRTGAAETAEIKQIFGARYTVDPKQQLDTPREVSDTMSELRRRLDDEPWADARPEAPQPFGASAPSVDLMKWFGG